MDKKQQRILRNILKKNSLPAENTFIQHRNLNEFRDFEIERINPNHRIILWGKLKSPYIHDSHYNKVVKVGEILLCMGFCILTSAAVLSIAINIITGAILTSFLLDRVIHVNWHRRECRNW